ncbi:MAG: heme ABC exporter ATP-binding protein CcmA [Candidatus Methanoperedens sp.]|nr:heme ABC exporter ATP-binding protein CcmA [Candidatus Methanoperedens nitroreducens]MDJ1420846.1 heme ABC exporter ATP-binding protein CcmA [Candidatus Methanoperedens sp.]
MSVEKLSKAFGTNIVLRNIDLSIEQGQFLTIFGPNGAGKTTLIKIISTLVSPTSGRVMIDGIDIKEKPIEIRKKIGVISHETYLYHELTAAENLRFFGRMYGIENNDIEAKIDDLLKQVGLSYRKNDRVRTFSRGMKQRLSIARALIHDPPILLLDEPYTGLDQHASATFDRILDSMNAHDKTRVLISHDIERGISMCDRAVILTNGNIAHEMSGSEIGDLQKCRAIYERYVQEHA